MKTNAWSTATRWLVTTALFFLPGVALHAQTGVSNDSIVLGQSTALSGPLADLGQEILKGAKVYFDSVNAKGGINGRRIKLITKDDAYDVKKTVENIEGFISENNALAFFGTFGTPNNEALIPIAQRAGIPVFMPYTGSSTIRGKETSGVYNLRASYPDEAEKLIENLVTIGVKKISIAHQNNSFGREVLNATVEALKKRNLTPLSIVSVENNASNAAAATEQLLKSGPEAVVLGLAGKPTIEVIKLVNTLRKGTRLYALSVLATPGNLRTLGNDGTGVAISQVMPFPRNATIPFIREYQQAMTAAGHTEFSHISLEGYANAKVMTEALRRAGRQLTRASLVTAMESIRKYDLGGLEVSFGNGAESGSRFVELTLINSQGKLIK